MDYQSASEGAEVVGEKVEPEYMLDVAEHM